MHALGDQIRTNSTYLLGLRVELLVVVKGSPFFTLMSCRIIIIVLNLVILEGISS